MKHIILIAIITLISCGRKPSVEYIIEDKAVVGTKERIGKDSIYVKKFFRNTEVVEEEYLLVDSLMEGRHRVYYAKGTLGYVGYYKNGILYNQDTIYYDNGKINGIRSFKDGKVHGKGMYYTVDHNEVTERYFYEDSLYHDKTFVKENGVIVDTIYYFRPLILLEKDTFRVGEKVEITFYLPVDDEKYKINQFKLMYDVLDPEALTKTEINKFGNYEFFEDDKIVMTIEAYMPGKWETACFLDYINLSGEREKFEFNNRVFVVLDK